MRKGVKSGAKNILFPFWKNYNEVKAKTTLK